MYACVRVRVHAWVVCVWRLAVAVLSAHPCLRFALPCPACSYFLAAGVPLTILLSGGSLDAVSHVIDWGMTAGELLAGQRGLDGAELGWGGAGTRHLHLGDTPAPWCTRSALGGSAPIHARIVPARCPAAAIPAHFYVGMRAVLLDYAHFWWTPSGQAIAYKILAAITVLTALGLIKVRACGPRA